MDLKLFNVDTEGKVGGGGGGSGILLGTRHEREKYGMDQSYWMSCGWPE